MSLRSFAASGRFDADGLAALLRKSKRRWSLEELSDHFDVGMRRIRESLEALNDKRVNLHVEQGGVAIIPDIAPSAPTRIDVRQLKSRKITFGVTSDNHLASRFSRLDVLNSLYDVWAERGITDVYQGGNMIDGEFRGNQFDLVVRGVEGQLDYLIENWPQRKGINTHFVTGDDHEGWYVQREHVNVGQYMIDKARRAGREDVHFLGHMEHDIELAAEKGSAVMRLIHAGGGSAYAFSYSSQKIVESLQGGTKPHILLIGHYHKAEYCYPRGVHALQLGATQEQSPWMRKKRLESHLGGWTVTVQQNELGSIVSFLAEWHPFFDQGYYEKAWKYHWDGDPAKRRKEKAP